MAFDPSTSGRGVFVLRGPSHEFLELYRFELELRAIRGKKRRYPRGHEL